MMDLVEQTPSSVDTTSADAARELNVPTRASSPSHVTRDPPDPTRPSAPAPTPASARQPALPHEPIVDAAHYGSYRDLTDAIKKAPAPIVQQVIRENRQTCLAGSDFHALFVLNAMIDGAPLDTLAEAVQGHERKIVQSSGLQLTKVFTTQDIDRCADHILSRASPQFLDRALAQRLETIGARHLVNALARAERLGYDVRDVVEEPGNGLPENVIPSAHQLPHCPTSTLVNGSPHALPHQYQPSTQGHSSPAPPNVPKPLSPRPPPVLSEGARIQPCWKCQRPCSGEVAVQYHVRRNACEHRLDSLDRMNFKTCLYCGSSFASGGGIAYHLKSNVCGNHTAETAAATMSALQTYLDNHKKSSMVASDSQGPNQGVAGAQPQAGAANGQGGAQKQNAGTGTASPASRSDKPSDGPKAASIQGFDRPAAHLSAQAWQQYQSEVAKTEEKYGALMREAMQMPGPAGVDTLTKLKNRYNTKQSTTRKKFGIPTMKRKPAEIEAERARLLRTPNAHALWLEQERAARRLQEEQGSRDNGPRKRVALSEMGGLSESPGSAETTDPSPLPKLPLPRAMAQLSPHRASAPGSSRTQGSDGTGDGDLMVIDGGQGRSDEKGKGIEDSSSSGDDDGTPHGRPAGAWHPVPLVRSDIIN